MKITFDNLSKEDYDRFQNAVRIVQLKTEKTIHPNDIFIKMMNEYCARRRQTTGLEKLQELGTENILIEDVPIEAALRFYDMAREKHTGLKEVFLEVIGCTKT